jgi:hypothetical protein
MGANRKYNETLMKKICGELAVFIIPNPKKMKLTIKSAFVNMNAESMRLLVRLPFL